MRGYKYTYNAGKIGTSAVGIKALFYQTHPQDGIKGRECNVLEWNLNTVGQKEIDSRLRRNGFVYMGITLLGYGF